MRLCQWWHGEKYAMYCLEQSRLMRPKSAICFGKLTPQGVCQIRSVNSLAIRCPASDKNNVCWIPIRNARHWWRCQIPSTPIATIRIRRYRKTLPQWSGGLVKDVAGPAQHPAGWQQIATSSHGKAHQQAACMAGSPLTKIPPPTASTRNFCELYFSMWVTQLLHPFCVCVSVFYLYK